MKLLQTVLALSVLPFFVACAGTREEMAPPAPVVEESVNPGINDSYVDADPAQWVERFEREGREIFDRRQDIVAASGIERGMEIADVGTGTGLFLPLLSEAVGAGGHVFAVDIVPEFLMHIERRLTAEDIRNVETVLCTERSVELPDASVDLVFTCDVYHHFEYPQNTLASIRRALRPGGRLVVVDFERIPGESSEWILGHVRAGKDVVTAEILEAGFVLEGETELLADNYLLHFRMPE